MAMETFKTGETHELCLNSSKDNLKRFNGAIKKNPEILCYTLSKGYGWTLMDVLTYSQTNNTITTEN